MHVCKTARLSCARAKYFQLPDGWKRVHTLPNQTRMIWYNPKQAVAQHYFSSFDIFPLSTHFCITGHRRNSTCTNVDAQIRSCVCAERQSSMVGGGGACGSCLFSTHLKADGIIEESVQRVAWKFLCMMYVVNIQCRLCSSSLLTYLIWRCCLDVLAPALWTEFIYMCILQGIWKREKKLVLWHDFSIIF